MTRREVLTTPESADAETAGDRTPQPIHHGPDTIAAEIPDHRRPSSYGHRKLAAALVAGCVSVLKQPKPQSRQAVVTWESQRRKEVKFITNPRASAFWCEAAGVDWDAVVSKLKKQQLLTFATAA